MKAGSETVPPWRRWANPTFFILLLGIVALAAPAQHARAGSRNVGLGIGVLGGTTLLNELSKVGKSKKKKSTASKKTTPKTTKKAASSKKKSTGSSAARKEEDTPKEDDGDKDAEAASKSDKPPSDAQPAAASGTSATAATGTAALAATGAATAPSFAEAKTISSKSEIKTAQEHLKYMGYDVPELSGTFDLKTKIAVMQFQDSIGESPTGLLTVKQLQTLFVKASEKTARAK